MVPMALHLVQSFADVADEERQRATYCFCDEFQDTNAKQLQLLCTLACSGRVTVVGDVNQLIFGFQGANAGGFQAFASFYKGQSARGGHNSSIAGRSGENKVNVVRLPINYRSGPSIVGACNMLVENESSSSAPPSSPTSALATPGGSLVASKEGEMVSYQSIGGRWKTLAGVSPARAVQIVECSSEVAEFRWAASLIMVPSLLPIIPSPRFPSYLRYTPLPNTLMVPNFPTPGAAQGSSAGGKVRITPGTGHVRRSRAFELQ